MRTGFLRRLVPYAQLMRLDKPIGILLLLWPTLSALWIAAAGVPDPKVLAVFVLGVVVMRSAGCVINDLADRGFDAHVARTRNRPLVTGLVAPRQAWRLFALLLVTALALVLSMNVYTVWLSLGGAALAASYPYTKRYSYLPQVHLGAAFGWAIPMAFAAQSGALGKTAWLLYISTLLWALAYDTMYAMADREDDLRIGVKSTAILFGDADRTIIGMTQVLMFVVLLLVGREAKLGGVYLTGLAVAAICAVYQQVLIHGRERERCFRAFLNNQWLGLAVFLGIAGDYYLSSV
ncbi:MAG: 4-hydroxybenzoate octaprenyltransferase [Gammaproteobacteria bacterium]